MGALWHDKGFDRLRNLPAILKKIVFVTTSPGLPYRVIIENTHVLGDILHEYVIYLSYSGCPTYTLRLVEVFSVTTSSDDIR